MSFHPLVLGPHQIGGRHPHLVVVGGGGGGAAHRHDGGMREAGGVGGHDNDGDAPVVGGVGIGPAGQPDVVGLIGARRPHLLAVDHPLVAVSHRPGGERGQVGARARLAVADGEQDVAGQNARQIGGLVLLGAVGHQRGPHGVEGDERHGAPGPLGLVEEDELVDGRPTLAAVGLGPPDAQHPVSSQAAEDLPSDRAGLMGALECFADLIGHEAGEVRPQLGAERALVVCVIEMHRATTLATPAAPYRPAEPPGPVRG